MTEDDEISGMMCPGLGPMVAMIIKKNSQRVKEQLNLMKTRVTRFGHGLLAVLINV